MPLIQRLRNRSKDKTEQPRDSVRNPHNLELDGIGKKAEAAIPAKKTKRLSAKH